MKNAEVFFVIVSDTKEVSLKQPVTQDAQKMLTSQKMCSVYLKDLFFF